MIVDGWNLDRIERGPFAFGSVQFIWDRTEVTRGAKRASRVLPIVCTETGIHLSEYYLLCVILGVPATRFRRISALEKEGISHALRELLLRGLSRLACSFKSNASVACRHASPLHPIYDLTLP